VLYVPGQAGLPPRERGNFKTNLLFQADRAQAGLPFPRKVLVSCSEFFAFLFSFNVMVACYLVSLRLWRSLLMAFLANNNPEVCAEPVTRFAFILERYLRV
jgi:hypothetical protein